MGKAKNKAVRPPRTAPKGARTAARKGAKRWPLYAAAAIFLATRIYILLFADIKGSTLQVVDINYAFCWQVAEGRSGGFYPPGFFEPGIGFYGVQRRLRAASIPGHTPAEYVVEYPPLAIAWMVLPSLFLPPIRPMPSPAETAALILAFRTAPALVDVAGFVLLAWLLPIAVPPAGNGPPREWRLLVYAAGGLFLIHVLYDRLDIVVGVLVLAALGLLCRRVHYLASFAVLAVAIDFKLTPAILAPVWILGSLPASLLAGRFDRPRVLQLAGRAGLRAIGLAALGIALFLPFYLEAGKDTLELFQYHAARGLEIESTWASLDMLAGRLFGYATETVQNFGAHHVSSPITPALSVLSPLVTIFLLALAGVSLVRSARARLSRSKPDEAGEWTAAQAAPDLFTAYTVLFLLLGICASKVFSPQYLLWLVPLVPLLAPEGKTAQWLMAGFLVICLLTTAIFPYAFELALNRTAVIDGRSVILPPTALGIGIVVLRNLLLIAFAAALWKWRLRQDRVLSQ